MTAGIFQRLHLGADAAPCLLTILYPVYNLFYYHEGHEECEGKRQSDLSNKVIGCAIEVHKTLGSGLLESTYQQCLAHELSINQIEFKIEYPFPVNTKGFHEAQLSTYMKLANIKQGFLINFNVKLLKQGLKSFVL